MYKIYVVMINSKCRIVVTSEKEGNGIGSMRNLQMKNMK